MFKVNTLSAIAISGLLFAASCGKVNEVATEISNESKIQGHWLQSQSEHSGTIEKALENESVVLTFKDSQMAFSPTDSVKGQLVYTTLSRCTAGPRPFITDANTILFAAAGECPERRITVQQLDDTTLKFPDPENGDITRVFLKIDDNRYMQLVKASDRRP